MGTRHLPGLLGILLGVPACGGVAETGPVAPSTDAAVETSSHEAGDAGRDGMIDASSDRVVPPPDATVCDPGWGDCDGVPDNGCETSLIENPDHCGECGHSCQGGACAQGQCQAVVLANGLDEPWDVGVDSARAYWTDIRAGTVMSIGLYGGSPSVIALSQQHPTSLDLDATHVYWINDWEVMSVPIAGGAASLLAMANVSFSGLAVSDTDAYWGLRLSGDTGGIMTVPLAGGQPSQIVTGETFPLEVAVDDTHVYWGNAASGTIMALPFSGGTPTALASGQSLPQGIAVDAAHVYWTDIKSAAGSDGTIMRVAKVGGNPTELAGGQPGPGFLDVDDTHVYWTNWVGGTVMGVPLVGGPPTQLASNQEGPHGIAVGEDCVVWTNRGTGSQDGSVMKVAK